MLLTLDALPSSPVNLSVEIWTSRTFDPGTNRFRTISATSTALEIDRPRAFTVTSPEPLLNCVTTART